MKKLSTAIITTGLVAGTMDITAACVQFFILTGKGPALVLNFISSSIVGSEVANSGGVMWSVTGLLMHYSIAFGWTILFYFLYSRISLLRGNKIVVGLFYGIFVWIMMNFVLVPLTQIGYRPFNLPSAAVACTIIMVCIGLPVSLLANTYFRSLSPRSRDKF